MSTVKAAGKLRVGDKLNRWVSLGPVKSGHGRYEWLPITTIRKVQSQTHGTRYYVKVALPEDADPFYNNDYFYLSPSSRHKVERDS